LRKEKRDGEGTNMMADEQGFCRPNRNVYERVVCNEVGEDLDAAGIQKTRKVDATGPDGASLLAKMEIRRSSVLT